MGKKIIYLDDAIDAIEKSRFPGAPYIDAGILIALREIKVLPSAQPTPCDVCRHNPPSSMDGKPCCVCPAERRTDATD